MCLTPFWKGGQEELQMKAKLFFLMDDFYVFV